MATVVPNECLYISNLKEKINIEELRKVLYYLFTQYGRVIDIVVSRKNEMRGQAHIVFQDIPDATSAMRALQNFPLFDKPIFAVDKANATKQLETQLTDYYKSKRRLPLDDEGDKKEVVVKKKQKVVEEVEEDDMEIEDGEEEEGGNAPNRILFLQHLSKEVTAEMLKNVFQQYQGFKEVRMVPTRPDIAFVEFSGEQYSMKAKDLLDGFKLNSAITLKISFAKK